MLVVVMGGVALVLDRLWLDMAVSEAQSVADVAALAAARQLANDDDLRSAPPEDAVRIAAAKVAAVNVAAMNRVAGKPFELLPEAGDLQFGVNVQVEETGEVKFIETIHRARAVRAVAQRTQVRGNPVALLIRGLTHLPGGDVLASAEATIDNHIVGFQTVGGARVPMIPLAILANDPTGLRQDTWQIQIEQRRGSDNFNFDSTTGKIQPGPDGIPEITLLPANQDNDPNSTNMGFFDVHGEVDRFPLPEQIRLGWSPADLERRDGRFLFIKGPEVFLAQSAITNPTADALNAILGECRGAMLYQNMPTTGDRSQLRIQSAGLVAGRVVAVQVTDAGKYQIVFQPGVLASRSAVRPSDMGMADADVAASPYIYQLKLTQ